MNSNNYNGALQSPVGSRYSGRTIPEEVMRGISLQNVTAIVTGGSTGIGLETVKALVAAGADVIVPARDIQKAERNLKGLERVEIQPMDLLNPQSIDQFSRTFLASEKPLQLLIHNAGIMWVPFRRDARGLESQLATNYLAQFQLTALLWPALKKAGKARVIHVSSQGHQFDTFHFEDPHFRNRAYNTLQAYGQSKTAVNLFACELDARGQGLGIRAYSLHPGSIRGTELAREAPLELFVELGFCDASGKLLPEVEASLKTIPQGAATTLWCATSPLLENLGGVYCEDCEVAPLAHPEHNGPGVRTYSLEPGSAQKLWTWSEKTTGISFNPA